MELRQIEKGNQGIGMFRAECLLVDAKRLPEERLGQLIFTLGPVEYAQVIEALDSSRMLWSKHLLADDQGLPMEPFRLLVVTLETSEYCQDVEAFSGSRMIRSKHLLADDKSLLMEGLGLRIETMNVEKCPGLEEQLGRLWEVKMVLFDEYSALLGVGQVIM